MFIIQRAKTKQKPKALWPLVFLLGIYVCCVSMAASASSFWKLKKNQNNINTYTQSVPGSKYKAAKHVAVIETTLDKFFDIVGDGSACNPWLSLCESAKIIEKINDLEYVGYAVINMPWPLSKRDFVYRSTASVDSKSGTIVIEQVSEPSSYPKSNLVRMESKNTFYIEPMNSEHIRLTWIVHSNPGGNVPASIVNSRIHKDTRKDLLSLVQHLSEY